MKKLFAVAVFALVMLGAAGSVTVVSPSDSQGPPPPVCDPKTQTCT